MNKDKKIFTIVWPTHPANIECDGVIEPTEMLPIKICINKVPTSKKQRDKFDKDLVHIARKDLTNK